MLTLHLGYSPNLRESYGITPLHESNDAPEAMDILIRSGGDVNAKTSNGDTVLYSAVQYRATPLVSSSEEQNLEMKRASDATCANVCKLLIAAGAKVNEPSSDRHLPLEIAAGARSPEVLEILLKGGALINLKGGPMEETALTRAASACRSANVYFLLRNKANASLSDKYGKRAVERAKETLKLVRESGPFKSDFITESDCEKTFQMLSGIGPQSAL